MKSYLLAALGKHPPIPRRESDWKKTQRIGREACAKIPELVDDSRQETWTELMRLPADKAELDAAHQLQDALKELGIKSQFIDRELEIVLRANIKDLRRVAKIERTKSDAAFLEMMRAR